MPINVSVLNFKFMAVAHIVNNITITHKLMLYYLITKILNIYLVKVTYECQK